MNQNEIEIEMTVIRSNRCFVFRLDQQHKSQRYRDGPLTSHNLSAAIGTSSDSQH